jgi:DNA-binding transcriptional regulator GbsR (MarR family)
MPARHEPDPLPVRDVEAVRRFIERFSGVLAESGWPRMPARVFVALLSTDSGRLTAAELSELLQVSPAAVSGAVRYLTQVNLASRERAPGSRRDLYRVHEQVWHEALVRRDQLTARWNSSLREGIEALGPDTPAATRLEDTLGFFSFMAAEIPAILERWHARRVDPA